MAFIVRYRLLGPPAGNHEIRNLQRSFSPPGIVFFLFYLNVRCLHSYVYESRVIMPPYDGNSAYLAFSSVVLFYSKISLAMRLFVVFKPPKIVLR